MTSRKITLREDYAQVLLRALDLRDKATVGHSHRVSDLCVRLGQAMGLSEPEMAVLKIGGLLHDIGKIGIPDIILLKPAVLTPAEREIVQSHSTLGAEAIRGIPALQDAASVVEFHHERWDGRGYPRGLRGEGCPRTARICAVAEAFDGLLSEQVYKPTWSLKDVLQNMKAEAGTAFDPGVVNALLRIMGDDDGGYR